MTTKLRGTLRQAPYLVYGRRSCIIQVFIFGHICFWHHDISHSDYSQHCLHAVPAKHSVCSYVSRAVSRIWPFDVRGIVRHWTLIYQSWICSSPVGLIWLYFIRLCTLRLLNDYILFYSPSSTVLASLHWKMWKPHYKTKNTRRCIRVAEGIVIAPSYI